MALADWDPRLMTPARALALVGDWPFYGSLDVAELSQFEPEGGGPRQPNQQQMHLRCGHCHQSMWLMAGSSASGPLQSAMTTNGDLLSAVLRHLVMAHDVSLSAAAASVSAGKEEDRG